MLIGALLRRTEHADKLGEYGPASVVSLIILNGNILSDRPACTGFRADQA
jgi:hypothetical protein